MVEPRLIEHHFGSGFDDVGQIGRTRPLHQFRIATSRYHEPHVNARERSRANGKKNGLCGQKIRALHVDIMPRREQNAHIALHDVGPRLYGTARDELRQAIIGQLMGIFRIITMVGKQGAVDEIPIDEKGALQRIDDSAPHLQMGVAPGNATPATNVAQGNVHSANKSYRTIDDTEFAMVAIVHLARECRKTHGDEWAHPHTLGFQTIEKAVVHIPTSHIVVDDAHLYPLPRFVNQCIGNELSQGIVVKNIGVDVDVVGGLSDGLEQR